MANPGHALMQAIVTKLIGNPLWIWRIFGIDDSPGTLYLDITNIIGVDASAKQAPVKNFLISFDAWDHRDSADTGTDKDILEMLYVMETILTLNNHVSGLTKLTLGGGFRDASHLPESGPETVPNQDRSIRHARQIIKFTIEE